MESIIPIQGMTCGGCVNSVKRALAALPGVSGVEVDLASGQARVTHDERQAPLDALRAAVVQAGFETR
jgi:copper chaperone